MAISPPLPGTIILTTIEGPTNAGVWLLQALNGDLSRWTHAAIMLDKGEIFEATSDGARISRWTSLSRRPVKLIDVLPAASPKRSQVVAEARRRVGTPYNWTTYFYLAAYRLRLPLLTPVLRRRAADTDRMICSQAVDDIFRSVGVQLFTDGRLPHDVTPGDLARLKSRY